MGLKQVNRDLQLNSLKCGLRATKTASLSHNDNIKDSKCLKMWFYFRSGNTHSLLTKIFPSNSNLLHINS